MSWPLKVLSTFAGLLVLFLLVGLLLPGTWSTQRQTHVDAPPADVFAWVDAPTAWRSWTAWPDVPMKTSGPASGVGASVRWDDPDYGDGVFTITASEPPRTLAYEVRVQHGSLVTRGHIQIDPEPGGSRVTWREDGDFGWNPLLGYAARGMDHMQGAELEKGLTRLAALAAQGPPGEAVLHPPAPGADTTAADTTAGDTAGAASPAGLRR